MNKTLPAEQDVDQLFRSFFQSEVPHEWPAVELPVRRTTLPFRPAAALRRRFVLGSKLALAASVALLTLCGWLLSGAFDTSKKADPFNSKGGTAQPVRPDDVPLPPQKDKAGIPFDSSRQD